MKQIKQLSKSRSLYELKKLKNDRNVKKRLTKFADYDLMYLQQSLTQLTYTLVFNPQNNYILKKHS